MIPVCYLLLIRIRSYIHNYKSDVAQEKVAIVFDNVQDALYFTRIKVRTLFLRFLYNEAIQKMPQWFDTR